MKVADLIPASSPSDASFISTSKPRRSAQRRYIRSSISAQSCESVPPAPERTVTTASPESYSPLNRRASSSSASRDSIEASWRVELGGHLGVLGRHLGELAEVGGVGLEPAEGLEPPLRAGVLGGGLRGALLVVPEAGRAHLALEPGYLGFELGRVKGSPRAGSSRSRICGDPRAHGLRRRCLGHAGERTQSLAGWAGRRLS